MSETRDRVKNPSINFPESQDEALRAVIHQVRRGLFDPHSADGSPFKKTRTTDAGLGHTRSQQQTDWLNEAASIIKAVIEDRLDDMERAI
jgi:hypothetical protein